MKKLFGTLLIIISILLLLVCLGSLSSIFSTFFGFFHLFDSKVSAFEKGKLFGNLSYWLFHFCLIFLCLFFGFKFLRR